MQFTNSVNAYCYMREAIDPLPEKVKIKVTTQGTGAMEKLTWGWVPEKIVKLAVVDKAVGTWERAKSATNSTWNLRAIRYDIAELKSLQNQAQDELMKMQSLAPQEKLIQLEQMYQAVAQLSAVGRTWQSVYEKVHQHKADKLRRNRLEPVDNQDYKEMCHQKEEYKGTLEVLDGLKSDVQSSLFELVSEARTAVLNRCVEKSAALLTQLNAMQHSEDISIDLDRIEGEALNLNPEDAVKAELATLLAPFQVEGEEHSIFGRLSPLLNKEALQLTGQKPIQVFNERMGQIKALLSEMKVANALLDAIHTKRAQFQRFNISMSTMVDRRKKFPNEESPAPVLDLYRDCAELIASLRIPQQDVQGEQPVILEARNQLTLYNKEWIEQNNLLQLVVKGVLPRYVDFSEAVSYGLPLDFSGEKIRKENDHYILEANGIYVGQMFYPEVQKYVCENMESDTPWTLTKYETQKRIKDIGKGAVASNRFRKK